MKIQLNQKLEIIKNLKMITSIFVFLLFGSGYLCASVHWETFLDDLLTPTQYQGMLAIIAVFTLVGFVTMVYVPASMVIKAANQRFITNPKLGQKKVSVRKVIERRGSWPLAYKNIAVEADF